MEQVDRAAMIARLWEWGSALDDCERRRREIYRLQQQAIDADQFGANGIYSFAPRCASVGDPTGKAVVMKEQSLERINVLVDEINAVMARKAEIDVLVSMLPEAQQRLLNMRYVQGMQISDQIPKALHADRRTVYRWHDAILSKLLLKMSHNVP